MAVDLRNAFDSLASRRVLLFGGKGGVGKTTISALAALHFSQTRKVVLFTTDPASNLQDLFSPAIRDPRSAIYKIEELDAQALYKGFLDENLPNLLEIGDRGTYLDREELKRFFELSLPGVDELMAWMRIGELAEQNEDALLVVDTAPTGHTVRMLGAGEHFRQFAQALDTLEAKHRSLVRQFTRRNVRDAIDDYIVRFDERARRRRELLTNREITSFVPVFLSEPWVVEQTLRLAADVRQDGIDVPVAILNRAVLDPDCELDRERQKRDAQARERIGIATADAARSCVPLDSIDALQRYLARKIADRGSQIAVRVPLRSATCDLRSPIKLVFLAGKGGVGKTTCAVSIALQLAQKHPHKRYTVISVDPAHGLREVFASEAPPQNLSVEIVDTREKWRRLRETLGREIERAVGAITPGNLSVAYDTEAMKKLLDIAPPGADELFAVSRLADLAADESQDRVIVDTAPTGHFLRLLELPKTAGDWVREFMRILLRYREIVPPGQLGEELVNASRAMHLLEATLRSERSTVIVVTRPERVVIAETKRLLDSIRQRSMHVSGVIANYIAPENDCRCDQSMRRHALDSLQTLGGDFIPVERREAPVTKLAELATLFRVESD
ncbi:MAG: ArsA family ATPase [Thermoanaerobaculia bacterium]